MFTITSNLIFNPEHIACVAFDRNKDGTVKSARILLVSGQDLNVRDETAQEVVDFFSSNNNSSGTTAAISER